MKQNTVLDQALKTFGKGYEYGNSDKKQSRTGQDTNGNGLKEVDCSFLVAQALHKAGFNLGLAPTLFNTRDLFKGQVLTPLAKERFDFIKPATTPHDTSLRPGDIVLFKSTNGSSQHMGIFQKYDTAGHPVFFGSQSSKGPAFATIGSPGTYWNGKNQQFIGVLRPKDSFFTDAPNVPNVPNVPNTPNTLKAAPAQTHTPTTANTPNTTTQKAQASNAPLDAQPVKALVNFLKSGGVEGYRAGIYADSVGVPTVGNGFALVVHAGKDKGWVVRPEAELKSLFKQAGLPSTLYDTLPHAQLNQAAQLLRAHNPKGAGQLFGDGKHPKAGEFSLSPAQADNLTAAFVNRYIVPLMAKGLHMDIHALTTQLPVGQFVAIGSRLYQSPAWLGRVDSLAFRAALTSGLTGLAAELLGAGRGLRGQKETAVFHTTPAPTTPAPAISAPVISAPVISAPVISAPVISAPALPAAPAKAAPVAAPAQANGAAEQLSQQPLQDPLQQTAQQPNLANTQHLTLANGAALTLTLQAGKIHSAALANPQGATLFQTHTVQGFNIDPATGVVRISINPQGEQFEYEPSTGHSAWTAHDDTGALRRVVMNAANTVVLNQAVDVSHDPNHDVNHDARHNAPAMQRSYA